MTPADLPSKIRVLLADDHAVLRDGLASIIDAQPDMSVVGSASTGRSAVESFRSTHPDVTLMDIRMPDMNGIDAIAMIRSESADARIVVLTTYKGDVQALRALKAGAAGYLLKSSLRKELLETIRAVHAGGRRVPAEIAIDIAEHASGDLLSDRETQVLRHVARGSANKQIAAHLKISEETVKAHLKSILAKLGAHDRTHAVTIGLTRGFIEID
jgi:DNA-binding NarL/FixJ family response regulator